MRPGSLEPGPPRLPPEKKRRSPPRPDCGTNGLIVATSKVSDLSGCWPWVKEQVRTAAPVMINRRIRTRLYSVSTMGKFQVYSVAYNRWRFGSINGCGRLGFLRL